MDRAVTKKVNIGGVAVGGGARVSVQSMLNTKTTDVSACLGQIRSLHDAGCDIVRVSVPDEASASALREIVSNSPLPVVADIHFDYKLAVLSAEAGAHKLRINPGNIGGEGRVKLVADAARAAGIPIRVGVNSGSVESELLQKYGNTPRALAESAGKGAAMLERAGFSDIVLSAKSSSVSSTVEAYRQLSKLSGYPLHLGVTEAGGGEFGIIKGAVGIGSLLLGGIGDTLRVSLTGDPVREIAAAKGILRACGLERGFAEVIACPTCARSELDVDALRIEVEKLTAGVTRPLKIAVMGCVVNGIGEGKEADIGVAGGRTRSVLFLRGKQLKTVDNASVIPELKALIDGFLAQPDTSGES